MIVKTYQTTPRIIEILFEDSEVSIFKERKKKLVLEISEDTAMELRTALGSIGQHQ